MYNFIIQRICLTWCIALVSLFSLYAQEKSTDVQGTTPKLPPQLMSNGSQGRLFYICMPMNDSPAIQENGREIYITSSFDTYVDVSISGGTRRFPVQKLMPRIITLRDMSIPEIAFNEQVTSDFTIKLESPQPISVYVFNGKVTTTDGYLAIPVESWGTEYVHLSHPDYGEIRPWAGGFVVLASEDNTEVRISIRQNRGEYNSPGTARTKGGKRYGDSFVVYLNKGDLYSVEGDGSTFGTFDLSGSVIKSTKPVGVISHHNRTVIPQIVFGVLSRNYLIEMMPPTNAWGKQYYTTDLLRDNRGDYFRIVTKERNTIIQVRWIDRDGVLQGRTITLTNPYETATLSEAWSNNINERESIRGWSSWTSNKPFLLMQYSYSAGWDGAVDFDPFMFIVTPVEQFTKNTIFQTTTLGAYKDNFFNLVALSNGDPTLSDLKSLKLDDKFISNIDPTFLGNKIPGTNLYYARLRVSKGPHRVFGLAPFGGYIYGFGSADAYGYPAAFAFRNLSVYDTLAPELTKSIECGDYTYKATEIRNFKVNDTLNHEETGLKFIEFVENLDDNYKLTYLTFNRKVALEQRLPTSEKVFETEFTLTVKDKTKDAYAVFYAQDGAENFAFDTVRYIAPRLTANPNPIDFKNVRADQTKDTIVTITNPTDTTLIIRDIRMKLGANFSIISGGITGTDSIVVLPKQSINIGIRFTPSTEHLPNDADQDSLLIKETCAPFAFYVRGRGVMPHIQVDDWDAGTIRRGDKVCYSTSPNGDNRGLRVRNTGTDTLIVTAIDESSLAAAGFLVQQPITPTLPWKIAPGGTLYFKEICFQPTNQGSTTTRLPFISNAPSNTPISRDKPFAELRGRANVAGPEMTSIVFRNRVGTSATKRIVISNTGMAAIKVTNIVATPTNGNFTYIGNDRNVPQNQVTINPGGVDVINVDIRYSPLEETINGITHRLPIEVTLEDGTTLRDTIIGTSYIEKIATKGADLGVVLVGTAKVSTTGDDTELVHLHDVSESAPLAVASYTIDNTTTGNNFYPGDFAIVDLPIKDATTNEIGKTLQRLKVRFTPSGVGLRRALILVHNNAEGAIPSPTGDTIHVIEIRGTGNQLGVENDSIDFRSRMVLGCDSPLESFTIRNTSPNSPGSEITLSNFHIVGPDAQWFSLGDFDSVNVLPGQSNRVIPVRFNPSRPASNGLGTYSAQILYRASNAPSVDQVCTLRGEGRNVSATFVITTIDGSNPSKLVSGKIGDEFVFDVSGRSPSWADASVRQFKMTIGYPTTSIRLAQQINLQRGANLPNDWVLTSENTYRNASGDSTYFVIRGQGITPIQQSGSFARWNMLTLVPMTRIPDFNVDIVTVEDSTRPCLSINGDDTKIAVTNCWADGRSIVIGSPLQIRNVTPTPTGGNVVNIDLSVPFDMHAKVEIVNSMGAIISVPVNDMTRQGEHTLTIQTEKFANGTYFVRLTALGTILSKPFIIVR